MKTVKESKITIFIGIALTIVLCVVWVVVKQYKLLIIGAGMIVCLIIAQYKPILKYDENGIELQMSPKNMLVPWNDVVYIGERISTGFLQRKAIIVQVKWLWGEKEHIYTVKMSYNAEGATELLEYYQNVLREMQTEGN